MPCDRVVVSVPLGVLKGQSITFTPALPAEKAGAIARIGFGNYEKIAMRFDKFYWPREPQRFNYLSSGEPSLFHAWLNVGHYTGDPILVAYHAGRRARHINQLSDDELVTQVVDVMQRMFGGNGFGTIPMPEAYVRTNWQADPFSQGSYSFNQVGQLPEDRLTLAQPINNRLFFAGEASHPHFYASVHGAYETGVRAAREIITINS
ncbi:MAG: NAD(P)/FAD-dependent oxidoreductase [Chloroflexota bacterium]